MVAKKQPIIQYPRRVRQKGKLRLGYNEHFAKTAGSCCELITKYVVEELRLDN